jgi:hypothetical protein
MELEVPQIPIVRPTLSTIVVQRVFGVGVAKERLSPYKY